ncbi:MAG: biogenesis protein MshI [Marinobacter sp.]|nr:biogenesis protein MshI [Marinobacter sp.]
MDDYQVFQLERPEGIASQELADALRWKLKDMIDYSPADAVCDVFEFPVDASRGRGELVNLAVARKSLVAGYLELLDAAGLVLHSVNVAELALRNLAAGLDAANRSVALVHLSESYGQMVVCRGDTLYLSRRLDVALADLRDASRQEVTVQSLALEVQRSLDYFESQLGQLPPRQIHLLSQDRVLPLAPMLSAYVAVAVEPLDLQQYGLPREVDPRCLLAWCEWRVVSPVVEGAD